jgi:hypothetical protein
MIPRTYAPRKKGSPRQVYLCRGRVENGPGYCPAKPILREPIDAAVFDYFANVGLDLEATREQLAAALNGQLADVQEALHGAERQERQHDEAIERAERDYAAGELSASTFEGFTEKYREELAAARAHADQLRARERELRERPAIDAEQATLRRLAELRAAVAGEVTGARDLGAVRLALGKTFERFLIGRVQAPESELAAAAMEGAGEPEAAVQVAAEGSHYLLIPEPREEVIEGLDPAWEPVLKREPLPPHTWDGVGLHRWSSAPRAKLRTRSASPARPLSTITGRPGSIRDESPSAARTRSSSARPLPSSSARSSTTSAG